MMPSTFDKQRVLIVGAKFGEMYLNAFMQSQEGLELVGLLAQGSPRAKELAQAFGIPLYTSLEQIKEMPDIACIVVRSTVAGGSGTQLARHFLTHGAHVIQEHPSTRMMSVHYKRWRRNRGVAIGSIRFIRTRLPVACGSGTRSSYVAVWIGGRRLSMPPPAGSCSTPLSIYCCWVWAWMPPAWRAKWSAASATFTV